MKKCISMFVVVLLFVSCMITPTTVHAATKTNQTRSIAIVFDNSGSMYFSDKNNSIPDWSRATYAMEVFASMLNKGDLLTIYPMHEITVEGKSYTMDNPFKITDSSQASKIREIYTPKAGGTPITSIDSAAAGLKSTTADKKYLIVLTDGDAFDGFKGETANKKALDSRFKNLAGPEMTVMYLGVGEKAVMPDTANSDFFVKKHAKKSDEMLSSLTEMCNKIFGRDELKNDGKTISFDISMNKVIVFVQGKDITNLKVTGSDGKEMGKVENTTSTSYSKNGGVGKTTYGNKKSDPDTSLQGMMVTYTDCSKGNYNIKFSGNATSVAVYYEPNIDLAFIFTDEDGNEVDPNELYEGNYKVSFGMKDGKTGQLIENDKAKLLGTPKYEGSYFIDGNEKKFNDTGLSGEVDISLKMGQTFEANLTATYLDDYTIKKDSTDFGWPKGGIKVVAMPAGKLKLEISGGEKTYSLQSLENSEPFKLEISHQGKKLTGEELKKVKLSWDPNTSIANIKTEFANDHYKLYLDYKDPKKDTKFGNCKVKINASYTAQGSDEAKANRYLNYYIDEDESDFYIDVETKQDYIVIDELDASEPIIVYLYIDRKPLTAEQFAKVKLDVKCDKINYTLTPDADNSLYSIKLNSTENVAEDDYQIDISAKYTDVVGRTSCDDDDTTVTLSHTPLWLKRLIALLIILLIIFIIWKILHIRVLPKKIKPLDPDMNFNSDDVTQDTMFNVRLNGGQMIVRTQYDGTNVDLVMSVKPGRDSYLYKSQKKRSIEVDRNSVRRSGVSTILSAQVSSSSYIYDDAKDNLIQDPETKKNFIIKNGNEISYSGLMQDGMGKDKDFSTKMYLKFTK